MKKAKAKRSARTATRTIDRPPPRQKAALRSDAFAKAILGAKSYAIDTARLRGLFEEASRKAAAIPKEPFKDSWPYLQAMLRLIRAYFRGEYRNVAKDELLSIIAAAQVYPVIEEYFGELKPCSTGLVVQGLAREELLVEIDAWGWIDD